MEQYFIKITPNQELVKYGKLKVNISYTALDYFIIDNRVHNATTSEALKWINYSIKNKNNNNSKVLFFIHGFWGSLPYPITRTSKEFKTDYFKSDSSNIVAVIHIIWDAGGITYNQSIKSINNSKQLLANLLNNIENVVDFKSCLMCHSMGNRFLHQTISTNNINTHFEELILMAPDLDYRKFKESILLFSSLASTVSVFYHTKDQTLYISKNYNDIERLGRISKYKNRENINFIDCTNLNDIDNYFDLFNRHLYFLTSKTVKSKVEEILR